MRFNLTMSEDLVRKIIDGATQCWTVLFLVPNLGHKPSSEGRRPWVWLHSLWRPPQDAHLNASLSMIGGQMERSWWSRKNSPHHIILDVDLTASHKLIISFFLLLNDHMIRLVTAKLRNKNRSVVVYMGQVGPAHKQLRSAVGFDCDCSSVTSLSI